MIAHRHFSFHSFEHGIVAEGPGNVDIYSLSDVNVNTSRIFTLGGGNILIWSTLGNIDAGNGAKSSLSIPPPSVSVSSTGVITFNYTGAVAGSGIRTIQTGPGQLAGSVNLIAPVGAVVCAWNVPSPLPNRIETVAS